MGTLSGSCHCGAVVVNVARRPRQLTDCNCSICRRYGTLWAYYSPPRQWRLSLSRSRWRSILGVAKVSDFIVARAVSASPIILDLWVRQARG